MEQQLKSTGKLEDPLVDTYYERSIECTLSGTPGTQTTITLPDDCKGFRLYPRGNHVRFGVDYTNSSRTLAAVATDSTGTVAANAFAIGGIAKNDMWEVRLLPNVVDGNARRLKLRSITASVVVDVEIF